MNWRQLARGLPVAFGLLLLQPAVLARAGSVEEYQLKGAFLFNFAKFVEWPSGQFEGRSEFSICVAGSREVVEQVEEVVAGKSVRGLAVEVRTLRSLETVASCHILFLTASGSIAASDLAHGVVRASILTVGEAGIQPGAGGIISFTTEASRLRFEIHRGRAQEAGLSISSKLLKLASTVRE